MFKNAAPATAPLADTRGTWQVPGTWRDTIPCTRYVDRYQWYVDKYQPRTQQYNLGIRPTDIRNKQALCSTGHLLVLINEKRA